MTASAFFNAIWRARREAGRQAEKRPLSVSSRNSAKQTAQALLFTAWTVDVALVMAFLFLTGLGVSLSAWTYWQILHFPTVATRAAIAHYARYTSMVSPTRRQVWALYGG